MKSEKLYEKILFLLTNILKNETLKVKIVNDDEFYNYFLKLVKGLLFLEQEFNCEYESNTYSRHFLQVLADLRNESLKLIKEDNWTSEIISNDYSFLQTYILNVFKINPNELTNVTDVSIDSVKSLSDVNEDFYQKINSSSQVATSFENNNIEDNVSNDTQKENVNSMNSNSSKKESVFVFNKDVKNSQRNLRKEILLGSSLNLPQHPVHNQAFFPFTNKPSNMPIFRKILAIFFSILLVSILATIICGFIPKIEVLINGENHNMYPILIAWNVSMWNVLLEVLVYSLLTYTFFKKPTFLRDNYRLPPFTLILAIVIIIFSSIFGVFGYLSRGTFDYFFSSSFKQANVTNQEIENILSTIWNNFGFQIYRILKIIVACISIVPILLIGYIFSINPRLDRDKLRQADIEYQKALQASLKGENYEMDSSLFDQELILELEKQKDDKNKL